MKTIRNDSPAERTLRGRRALRLFSFCLALSVLRAPAPPSVFAADKKPVFVTASLVDRNDLFIQNLEPNEVEIFENGQPRKIELIARDELPTAYGLIFDRAMLPEAPERERTGLEGRSGATTARDIAYELIDKLLSRQAIWVGAYDQQLQVVFDATSNGFGAKDAIARLRGTRGQPDSFLYSALFSAVDRMSQRQEKRRVIILFLQSIDSETAGRVKPLRNLLAASNTELFVICTVSRLTPPGGMNSAMSTASLRDLAQATAGQAFFTMDHRDHPEDIVRRLLEHLRTFYTFGFTSDSRQSTPGKLLIKCSRPNSKVRHHPNVPDLD